MICRRETKLDGVPPDELQARLRALLPQESDLEEAFLDYTLKNHGAVVEHGEFVDSEGSTYRVGRLTSFLRNPGELTGTPLRDWEANTDGDLRIRYSVYFMGSIANIDQGMGDKLIPIGVLYWGEHHPDEMELTHANLLALDVSKPGTPSVVVWFNELGVEEAFRAEEEGLEDLDHSRMTTRVAPSFAAFLSSFSPGPG